MARISFSQKKNGGILTNYRAASVASAAGAANAASVASTSSLAPQPQARTEAQPQQANAQPQQENKGPSRSRGQILKEYLCEDTSAEDFLLLLAKKAHTYTGFNIILGHNHDQLWYFSNRMPATPKPILLSPGCYGLSNHLLNSPWPKVADGLGTLSQLLKTHPRPEKNPTPFFEALENRQHAATDRLPNTGVGLQQEKMLSSLFIFDPKRNYGTRSSVVFADYNREENLQQSHFFERCYDAQGDMSQEFSTTWPAK